MNKFEPNSIESIIFFILYICAQDGVISEEEKEELIAEIPLLKKLYLDFYGEYIDIDLKSIFLTCNELLKPSNKLTTPKVTKEEKILFNKLITDPTVQDFALLSSRLAASIDKLHNRERLKFLFWSKEWGVSS